MREYTVEKIAVVAPIQRASVIKVIKVKPLFWRNCLSAWRSVAIMGEGRSEG